MTTSIASVDGDPASLDARISAVAGTEVQLVRDVFGTHGLSLVTPPARPRKLRIHRLRIAGVRTGALAPGPFDSVLRFPAPGMTALVAANLRGKTSVLELVTWCLRGRPRGLQAGVRSWLSHVDLDATVGDEALGFRLDLADGDVTTATILKAPDVDRLHSNRSPSSSDEVTTLIRASSPSSFAEQVETLMLDRLDLHPLVSSYQDTGTATYGWPTYFSALYLPAAGDKVLLGEQAMGGIAGRLLQVFLDLPATAALSRVKTTLGIQTAQRSAQHAAATAAAQERGAERQRINEDLDRARRILAELDAADDEPSLADLAAEVTRLARAAADAQDAWDERMRLHRTLRAERQRCDKALNDVNENATARLLFHGLDPIACPRCDQDIADERRHVESTEHKCAVCARPVVGDDETPADIIAEAQLQQSQAVSAETNAHAALEEAEHRLDATTAVLAAAQDRLRRADSAARVPARAIAKENVVRLEGALSVLPDIGKASAPPAKDTSIMVLEAAVKLLDQDSKAAASALFDDLNREIAELGRRFGINALESVDIDRAARLKVTKDGGVLDWFKNQSPGERLRLRIAVVIALLRVGAAHGLSTHPGLLMIDSPKAEEVQELDAHTLIRELEAVARETNVQILITTADAQLARDVLATTGHIEGAEDGTPLW